MGADDGNLNNMDGVGQQIGKRYCRLQRTLPKYPKNQFSMQLVAFLHRTWTSLRLRIWPLHPPPPIVAPHSKCTSHTLSLNTFVDKPMLIPRIFGLEQA